MGELAGKSVIVTGAARGLGEAYARMAAEAGAQLVINDIDADLAEEVAAHIRRDGARAVAHNGDVSSWDFAESLISRCVEEYGRIDGLVNNAGHFLMAPIEEQTADMFRQQVETNLFGHAYCGIHALRRMMEQGSGSVINTFSGTQVGMAFRCAYSAAMSGIAGLTYSWASECHGTPVRVNAIAPIANTRELDYGDPILMRLVAEGRYSQAKFDNRRNYRKITTDMNAPMVIYLLSDRSSGVNGQGIRFTGKELQLLTHAAIRSPVVGLDEGLTVELIDESFAGVWKDMKLPLGLSEFEMAHRRTLT